MAPEWLLADALGLRSGRARTYRVFVRDLVLPCSIGVYEHERTIRQRVRIGAELTVADRISPAADDFSKVYNYEAVVATIRQVVGSGHIDLVETVAARIAALCLEDARVEEVRVTVEKLDPYPEADSVGVTLLRRRDPGLGMREEGGG